MPAVKVATCNFCGTRAALVLRGTERHELSCASCGAPLHDLKLMPKREPEPQVHRAPRPAASSHRRAMSRVDTRPHRRKKSFWRKAAEELWDLVEDVID